MKKILYIVTIPDWGGAQKYVFDSTSFGFDKSEFEITVAYGQPAFDSKINLMEKCKKSNIPYHQFKNLKRQISLYDLPAIWEIKKYIEKEKPDRIHLNSSKAGIVGSFAAKISNHKPQVWYTVHGWAFLEPMANWRKKLYIFLERLASKYRDKIIVLGKKEKKIALEYKICPEEKIEVKNHIYWGGQSLLEKTNALKVLNLPQNKKIIGTIANFYPAKALQNLIEVASKINNPDIIFTIIGDGPERNNYELLITNYKLQDRFLLLGEKDNASQYLNAFDLFVLPSIKEGMPYAILEAMQAKLPIVVTEVGAVPEMLENYPNKTIVPPADIEKLTEAIKKYL
ncbi:MAG: hypothetical protein COU51_04190 [Parcubacteria group bacterium CG10_big_fil_rev_8_21_14_0_10_36_14]|nr:MAG: hypothetical protein COU51_04190 [Parcubacteria group bacterium CG10_big_fil_rev_8_21_14_0_10_36_14]